MEQSLVGHRIDGPAVPGGVPARAADGSAVLLRRCPRTTEAAALVRAAGEHVLPLLDVGTAANGDLVLIVPRLGRSLAELLGRPGWPTVGEAVTIAVPLVQTVSRMHDAGVAHGAIDGWAVRFDDRGAPVLVGFGDARIRAAGLLVDAAFDAAAVRDRRALHVLLSALLREVGGAGALLGERVLRDAPQPEWIVDALFHLAEPQAVRTDPRPELAPPSPALPGRLIPAPDRPPWIGGEEETSDRVQSRPMAVRRSLRVALQQSRPALRAVLGTVRPRVWLAAGASSVLLVAAVVLLPPRGADAEAVPTGSAPSAGARPRSTRPTPQVRPAHTAPAPSAPAMGSGSAAPAVPAKPVPVKSVPATPVPVKSVPDGSVRASAVPLSADAAIVSALLRRRAACLSGGDASCLGAVEVAGGPLEVEDSAALTSGVEPVLPNPAAVRVRSRTARTVIAEVGDAIVLAMRDADAWRLRDVLVPSAD